MKNPNGRKNYLVDYADTVEALPLELQRNYTLIRQLDENVEQLMSQVKTAVLELQSINRKLTKEERRKRKEQISHLQNEALKKAEEKFALAKTTYDTVDRHCAKLDNDLQRIEEEQLIGPGRINPSSSTTTVLTGEKRSNADTKQQADMGAVDTSRIKNTGSRGRKSAPTASTTTTTTTTTKATRGRKRGRASRSNANTQSAIQDGETYLSTADVMQHAEAAATLSDLPIDPNEPVYCYCNQVSFGEMVACDNPDCEVEWFHLECVGLQTPPKGKWFCRNCIKHENPKKRRKL
ncbi:hypothetical protein BDF20DRAFT_392351 [Mycotypha africana]|uniref:uncharacterized protein n=1 Tax=Mycotypha africana TaxID=64632 RepID=UPI002300E34C|nr:uncharacterized protein BDF20DRAFT_392351 [Mycotypha africana]KAI8984478.1 hypothetical protein BDF20DRAFT_392351 [Mycotypha africana]